MRRAAVLFALLLMVGACDADDDPGPGDATTTTSSTAADATTTTGADDAAATAKVHLKGGGLVVDGDAVDFGDSYTAAVDLLSEALGDPIEETDLEECGGGATTARRWSQLTIYAMGNDLVGWFVRDGSPLGTVEGISTASTRANIEAAYADLEVVEGSLGTEWHVGEDENALSGTLTGPEANAGVEDMWSGDACIAR